MLPAVGFALFDTMGAQIYVLLLAMCYRLELVAQCIAMGYALAATISVAHYVKLVMCNLLGALPIMCCHLLWVMLGVLSDIYCFRHNYCRLWDPPNTRAGPITGCYIGMSAACVALS